MITNEAEALADDRAHGVNCKHGPPRACWGTPSKLHCASYGCDMNGGKPDEATEAAGRVWWAEQMEKRRPLLRAMDAVNAANFHGGEMMANEALERKFKRLQRAWLVLAFCWCVVTALWAVRYLVNV